MASRGFRAFSIQATFSPGHNYQHDTSISSTPSFRKPPFTYISIYILTFHLFIFSSILFINVLQFSMYISFNSLVKWIPYNYLMLCKWGCFVNFSFQWSFNVACESSLVVINSVFACLGNSFSLLQFHWTTLIDGVFLVGCLWDFCDCTATFFVLCGF